MWLALGFFSGVALFLLVLDFSWRVNFLFCYVNGIRMPETSKTVTFKRRDGSEVTFTKTGVRAAKRKLEKANQEVEKLSAKKQKTSTPQQQ